MPEDKTTDLTSEESTRDQFLDFEMLQKQLLKNLKKMTTRSTFFRKYSQSEIIKFLQSPTTYQDRLVEASRYFYNTSSHYRRLVQYYAYLPTFAYTLSPHKYDGKIKVETMRRQYYKTAAEVERMNLKHELQKAFITCMRDGVCYGVIWSNKDTWYIQQLDPTICTLSSIENGVWMYAVNMAKISRDDLILYPPIFIDMYNAYLETGEQYQEVPSDISFCLKADETNATFSIPPFVSTIPLLYSLETYKSLREVGKEIDNYKLLAMQLPTDQQGVPTLTWNKVQEYYAQVASVLPEYVGLAVSPFPINTINFEKSGIGAESNTISEAEDTFWSDSGTSPLLFGSAKNNTAGALKLSVKADECISFALLIQAERQINRFVTEMGNSVKFKITFLRVSAYNLDDEIAKYKELATLGFPVKTALAAMLAMQPADVVGNAFLENDVLKCTEIFEPLKTSYTQSASDTGRPPMDEEDLSEGGERTRGADSASNG